MRYIGSKTELVPEIVAVVNEVAPQSSTFCDLFAGTGVVGRSFKASHRVTSNDLLYFAYVINKALVELVEEPEFRRLSELLSLHPIEYLNSLSGDAETYAGARYITDNFSPIGDQGRMYLSPSNALRVDRMRTLIEEWFNEHLATEAEYYYLLASLLLAIPSVSNIAGTYGAFLKTWDKRATKELRLERLLIEPGLGPHRVHRARAEDLARHLSGDVIYLDPPYNGRQYISNYHLLETVALYDGVPLRGKTGTRPGEDGRSRFCLKRQVADALSEVVSDLDFKTVVLSYSSEGLLCEEQISGIIEQSYVPKSFQVRRIPHRRYKRIADDTRNSVTELLFVASR